MRRKHDKNTWAFVGNLANTDSDKNALSTAGQVTQFGFLDGCRIQERYPTALFSMQSLRVFPFNRFYFPHRNYDGVYNLSFINLPIIKHVSFAFNLLVNLIKGKYEYSIMYNPSFSLIIVGFLMQKFFGQRCIPIIFDIIIPNQNTGNKFLAYLNLVSYKIFLPRLTPIVISDSIARDFKIRKYLRIEGGLPPETVQKIDAIDVNKDPDNIFRVVFAGGLEKENGIMEIVDAFKMIDDIDLELHIYGTGPLALEVQKTVGNTRNIKLFGHIDHSKVLYQILSADLLLNIRIDRSFSTKYFFPSKLIEYLYSGRPILSTTFESMPSDYKTYVHTTDEAPNLIAEAISKIKKDKEIGDTRHLKGKEWVKSEKSWIIQSKKILNWIDECTGEIS